MVGSPARPNELWTRKTSGTCRTRMPQCTCIDGPFCPNFAGDRAKEKRGFPTDRQRLASCRIFDRSISDLQLICRIIQTDLWSKPRGRWHVSHDVHTSLPANTKLTWRKNRFASSSERSAANSRNLWRLKNKNAFPKIYSTLVSPCVAVFKSSKTTHYKIFSKHQSSVLPGVLWCIQGGQCSAFGAKG